MFSESMRFILLTDLLFTSPQDYLMLKTFPHIPFALLKEPAVVIGYGGETILGGYKNYQTGSLNNVVGFILAFAWEI